ncbi:MAG TPA: ribosome maturation factor RimM [Candidatus Azoamicus sp. OHIO1]
MNRNYTKIGKIITAHGLKGELKMFSFFNHKENIFKYPLYMLDKNYNRIFIKKTGTYGKSFIISIEGIINRNTAESLRSKFIYIEESFIKNTEYSTLGLINLTSYNQKGEYIGKVINIFNNKAHDILIIENKNKKKLFVPCIDKIYITEIDIKNGKILLNLENYYL